MSNNNPVVVNVGKCRLNRPAGEVAKDNRQKRPSKGSGESRESLKLKLNNATEKIRDLNSRLEELSRRCAEATERYLEMKEKLDQQSTLAAEEEPLPDPIDEKDMELKNPPAKARKAPTRKATDRKNVNDDKDNEES